MSANTLDTITKFNRYKDFNPETNYSIVKPEIESDENKT